MQEETLAKVHHYINDTQMLAGSTCVLAGVSGGSDSMAMLDMLLRLSGILSFRVYAVHVNHGIRGEEALRDQRVVEEFCSQNNIPLKICSYDVPALARSQKAGLEETGRNVRRQAFEQERKRLSAEGNTAVRIAIAHNRNDLAETMLHHLARGSGIRGLASMRAANGALIRPLLCLSRSEIDDYIKERQIPAVLDSTNLSDTYTRNRIRRDLIPVLEQEVNPGALSHMAETSQILSLAEDFFKSRAEELADQYREEDSYLLVPEFFEKEEIIRRYTVREILERLSGKSRDLTSVHIRDVLNMIDLETGKSRMLPYQLCVRRCYEGVRIFKSVPAEENRDIFGDNSLFRKLPQEGRISCPFGTFSIRRFRYDGEKILEKKYTKWFDCAKISSGLSVRTRRSGDYLILNETGEHKKLARYMIDEKIPAEMRDKIPLICCGSEVLWAVGYRIGGRCKITSMTQEVLEITYEEDMTDA